MTGDFELGNRIRGIDIIGSTMDLNVIRIIGNRTAENVLYFDHRFFFNKFITQQGSINRSMLSSILLVRNELSIASYMFFTRVMGKGND